MGQGFWPLQYTVPVYILPLRNHRNAIAQYCSKFSLPRDVNRTQQEETRKALQSDRYLNIYMQIA